MPGRFPATLDLNRRRKLNLNFMRCFLIFFAALASFHLFARESTLLDAGWKFQLAAAAGAQQIAFDDSGWQPVSVPHCWGWQDAQEGKMNYRGPGWYRRELDIVPRSGERYFLRFE